METEKYNPFKGYASELAMFKKLSPTDFKNIWNAVTAKASYTESVILFENDRIQLTIVREKRVGFDTPYVIAITKEEETVVDGYSLMLYPKQNGTIPFYSSIAKEFFRKLDDVLDFLKNL